VPAEPGVRAAVTGKVITLVKDRLAVANSSNSSSVSTRLSGSTEIKLILDNHFAHFSKEPKPGSGRNPCSAYGV
jgi:hypothetical protein